MWQWFGRGLVVLAGLILAASFAGDVHGIGNSLAVFRPIILVGCTAVAGLVWQWRLAQGLLVVAIGLGIDHVLATGGVGTLSVRPAFASDHRGLLASVEWQ